MRIKKRSSDWTFGAIDLFHLSTHDELAAQGMGPNSCALVAELDGRVDVAEVRGRLRRALREVPELSWRMGYDRRLERVWRRGGPGMTLRERTVSGAAIDAVVTTLDEPVTGADPWQLLLLHGPEHDTLAVKWFHPATDARGATRLLSWLGDRESNVPRKRFMTGDRLLAKFDGTAQRELTKAYVSHVFELGATPIMSLQRAAKDRMPGRQQAVRVVLSTAETKALYGSLRKRAGLADTSLMMWAAGRMFDRLLRARGFSPPGQLVPVPLSLDPKKGSRRMFGNHLTMMMLALDRDDLEDEAKAVAHLAEQRRNIVRNKLDVGMLAAIRSSRHVPRLIVDYLSRRPFGGERSSFVLSNPGAVDLTVLFGARVRDAYAVPTVLPAPGFQVTIDGFEGRLSLLVMFREGYVKRSEVESLIPDLKRDLLP